MDFEQLINASRVYPNNRIICRLCLNLITNDMYETLEDMQKGMLAVIIPEFNLDLACNPNVICKNCSNLLLKSYKFKSACMENSWGQQASNNCCLCLGKINRNIETNNFVVNKKLEKCLPELEVCSTSKVCQICQPLLETLFTFVTACLYGETKISSYISVTSHDKTNKSKEINLLEIYEHYLLSVEDHKNLEAISETSNDKIHCSTSKRKDSISKELNCRQLFESCVCSDCQSDCLNEDSNKDLVFVVESGVGFDSESRYFELESDGQPQDPQGENSQLETNICEEFGVDTNNLPNHSCVKNWPSSPEKSNSTIKRTHPGHECEQCDFITNHKSSMQRLITPQTST